MSISDIVAPIHVAALVFSVVGIFLADHQAFNWILGKTPTLDKKTLLKYHHWVLLGLFLMIITGAILFWPMREYLLQDFVFGIKMFFVAVLIVNGFFIGKLMNVAIEKPYSTLSNRERFPLMLSGAASTTGWLGAFIAANFLF
ncbi:MAG: hypothetical protein LiPW30_489 [Parcubacteria group bacterium LiPW_30]|nr:MAG: hypothetical protein LiPW30_489 [Parcubacteria group bacterium LiPW_30]